jgi:hypothetical protein
MNERAQVVQRSVIVEPPPPHYFRVSCETQFFGPFLTHAALAYRPTTPRGRSARDESATTMSDL